MKRLLGMVFLLLMTFAAPAFAQRYTVFPQFASGGGLSCELFFANQGLTAVSPVVVSFFDINGKPLTVTSNLGVGSQFAFTLGLGVTQLLSITPPSTQITGYVVVEYPSPGSPVRASLIYASAQGGPVQIDLGVPQQEQGDHFSFPVEVNSSEGIDTAVALINPVAFNNGVAETLVLNLINTDGSIQANTTVAMQPGQHIAQFIDQLFPGLNNFIGSISVSSPFGVGVLALRQNGQAFGGISTDGGPLLGPFVLTGTPIQDQEPSNTTATAMSITSSTIITGAISTPKDADAFKITGNAGDIISVICDTQGTGSSLDSYLEVYDSNLNLIARNDQNGLAPQGYPENDSFIQMALPANGTYYIVLSDAFSNGGSNYTYTLYIKLP
jgi:hypothetical protein